MSPNFPYSKSDNGLFWTYYVEPGTEPLPCILCGRTPGKEEKVMETLKGEAKLICQPCVDSANTAFFELDIRTSVDPLFLKDGGTPW